MWTASYEGTSTADADRLFAVLADVPGWAEWNPGVAQARIDGPFATGTPAVMTLPDGEILPFRLVRVEPGRGFEDETPIPDADVVVRVAHDLEPLPGGGTRIVYTCTVDGPGAAGPGEEIGPMVSGDFPEVIAALAARAEA